MKTKFLLLLFFSCIMPMAHGQSSKLVLLEEFSNTGCGPCAIVSPLLDSLLMLRLGDVVSIKYHVDWPAKKDEFYLNEKESQDIKKAFYEVTGVPAIIVDGKQVRSTMSDVAAEIDKQLEEESPFKIEIKSTLQNDKLDIKVVTTPLQEMKNQNLRLFVVLIEEEINLEKPSQNGEQHYSNILRKMLPDGNGYPLSAILAVDKPLVYEAHWQVKGYYNVKEMGIVAFIQDMSTQKVYQAAYSPRTSDATDAVKILIAEDIPDKICAPHLSPKIKFRNIGKNSVTSATLNVSVNGYTQQTPWTGQLEYLENEVVVTPDFTDYILTQEGNNKVEIWLSDINGTQNSSERYKTSFTNSLTVQRQARLTIFTDKEPSETTWKLFDSAGEIIDEGGPYNEPHSFFKKMLNIEMDDCYRLVFYDAGGNGIVGSNGSGYYKLEQYESAGKYSLVTQGDYKSAEFAINFKMLNADPTNIGNAPVTDPVNYDKETGTVCINDVFGACSLTLFDAAGCKLHYSEIATPGSVSLERFNKGIYLLQVKTDGNMWFKKIIIE